MTKVAFIFLHLGGGHPPSKEIMNMLEKSNVEAITLVDVRSEKMRKWLTNNEQGLKVTRFPCFLVAVEGQKTKVYPGSDASKVIEMIREFLEPPEESSE